MKFYDDPLYIEMCRGAGEIQAKWNPCIGDWALTVGCEIFGCGPSCLESGMLRMGKVFIPRLDQLIDMLDESVSKEYKTPYYKIWEFYEYAMVKTEPRGDWTTEQVMIQFVMYKKYRKEWDFDEKQWVKI